MADAIIVNGAQRIQVFARGASGSGTAGPQGPAGDVAKAATRSALAATASPTAGMARMLVEGGREGLFVFNTSNLSAKVLADTAKGIYVAPSSAPTGASGAWVRQEFLTQSRLNVRWFGAVGDGVTTDVDGPAILAALAAADAHLAARGEGPGAVPHIHIPFGHYSMGTSTLNPLNTVKITGDGSGQASGYATYLEWDDGCIGINSDSRGLILEGMALKGGFTDTEGEFHAIYCTRRPQIRDVVVSNWSGDGVYLDGTAGNVNGFIVDKLRAIGCRRAVYIDGADGNAGYTNLVDGANCRQATIYDSSFLGNVHYNPQSAGGALTAWNDGTTNPCSVVTHGGNRYTVMLGQEVGASTNAPSGTTADNTWWAYVASGGVSTGIPAWFSGINVRVGGAFITEGLNAENLFVNAYSEGSSSVAQFDQRSFAMGGTVVVRGVNGHKFKANTGGFVSYAPISSLAYDGSSSTFYSKLGGYGPTYKIINEFKDADGLGVWRWKVETNDIVLDQNNSITRRALCITGTGTTNQFGRSAPVPYAFAPVALFAGDTTGNSRQITNGTAAPTTGNWGAGDFCRNRAPTGTTSHIAGWLCSVAGTPGTWLPVYTGPKRVQSDSTTARTASLTDAYTHIRFSNAGAVTFTLPDDATVALPIDAEIDFSQEGAGVVTVAAGGSAVIRSRGGLLSTAGQYAAAGAKKVAANTWLLTGDLA